MIRSKVLKMEYRIGTMNEAYTVGRTELLAWLNDLLQTKYSRVEEVSNGLFSFSFSFTFVTIIFFYC